MTLHADLKGGRVGDPSIRVERPDHWLTTTLDDPAALPNYLGRGFRPSKQEAYSVECDQEYSLWERSYRIFSKE